MNVGTGCLLYSYISSFNKINTKIIIFFSVNRIRRVELLIEPGQSLGLMIRGGVEYGLGIFITGVDKDSVADRAGLSVSMSHIASQSRGQRFKSISVNHLKPIFYIKY